MIPFERHKLSNGLTVLCHTDHTSPLVCVNVLYDVGSRDESPDRTGFAHLFEHLMFSGSVNIPSYDHYVEDVGGENNAFTNNDITNYYLTVPASALETAFWLESDRMLGLAFSEKGLEVQRDVVVEEFRQRYLNQPYGDVWLLLRPMAYTVHPYRWPTIGMDPGHIAGAQMADVRDFFSRFYHPGNAILSVAGSVDPDEVFRLAERWFGDIPRGPVNLRNLPIEPERIGSERKEVIRDVPATALYRVYPMMPRSYQGFFAADLLSDILSSGNSSRFFQKLVKEKALFSELSAYVTGDLDPGLFVIAGKLARGRTMNDAEEAVNIELGLLTSEVVPQRELTKVQNKAESALVFGELNLSEKALNLAYYELMGDADLYNRQSESYRSVTPAMLKDTAASLFVPGKSVTLVIAPGEVNP